MPDPIATTNPRFTNERLQQIEQDILTILKDCFREYHQPAELTALSKRFAKHCEYSGFAFSKLWENMRTKGLIHVQTLPNLKRLVYASSDWNELDSSEQTTLHSRMLDIFASRHKRAIRPGTPKDAELTLDNPNTPPSFFADKGTP